MSTKPDLDAQALERYGIGKESNSTLVRGEGMVMWIWSNDYRTIPIGIS